MTKTKMTKTKMTKTKMTGNWLEEYQSKRDVLEKAHSYNNLDEHDSCGVGLVASTDGTARREIVELAISALKNVWHRGAVDADGKTGDGAGIMLDIPQGFFRDQVARTGHNAKKSLVAVGQIFLPRTDFTAQDAARTIVESELLKAGCYIYGWRQVPIDVSVIGEKAQATRPAIEQVLFRPPKAWYKDRLDDKLERELYIIRRRIEKRAIKEALPGFYVCSLSGKVIVYKGMFLAEQIDVFYPDLKDPGFISRAALYHQRYSTNTFPQWWLAHPYRVIAHNGEINTVRANINFMKNHEIKMASTAFGKRAEDVKPVIQKGSSDSAALDNVFELLVRAGRPAPLAKTLLVPEAYSKRTELMPESWRAFYEYCNAVMEPWDGPAALVGYDGNWVMAGLDRNGLRPLRYAVSDDGILAVGSEIGTCPMDEERIIAKGAIKPGRLIAVDLAAGKFYDSDQIIDELAGAKPYADWLQKAVELETKLEGPEPSLDDSDAADQDTRIDNIWRQQIMLGRSLEELDMVLKPLAQTGKEAIGSMGDDTPLAVLSDEFRPLSHFFRQKFSQVTNPPIDPLRETRVMGLKTRFRNLRNILAEGPDQTDQMYVLESPVMTNGMIERYLDMVAGNQVTLECCFPPPAEGTRVGTAFGSLLKTLKKSVEKSVRAGVENIVLSDMSMGKDRIPAPMILCIGAVHTHLIKQGLRSSCSILVRTGEALDTHTFAVMIGAGATAVNPWLTQETLTVLAQSGGLDADKETVLKNYRTAIDAGLLKIISKAGISVISSYRGGNNFEALGLSRTLVDEYFPGMTSRISGIGLAGLERKICDNHRKAYASAHPNLPIGGYYKKRFGAERHAYGADMISDLQQAVRTGDYRLYKRFSRRVNEQAPIQIRDLLDFNALGEAVPISHVENVNEIRRRFLTQAMSLGALSPEAHGALNIAMNRIGARSVSGEGGEDPARYKPLPGGDNANSEIKQIASGRFGVTAEYLNNCREIEIKVAQGAKPGEGGQLPGFKVTEMIARLRHATPGVTLISPPPHHDIYSIEDLAQLIYDLKQINPHARVCVKLVASSGVGTIAAGVAKAKADTILIAGHNGGTGASPLTSLKHAGVPWELGLSEVHQILTLNGLRDQITLRTDGGLKTGRDIVIAAMLGAEEYGVGTLALVAMGCLMVRQCHSNTCPVGVCTQDEDLRARFKGTPEHVINLMTFIAEDVREILASIGATSLSDIIGRADLLSQVSRGATHLDDLDLNAVLTRIDTKPVKDTRALRVEVPPSLDEHILADGKQVFETGRKTELVYTVKNTDRAVGTRASSEIYTCFGVEGLAPGQLTIRLRGSAGQSLGAFGMKGLRLIIDGDANDYVGKGLSGAEIFLSPQGLSWIDAHNSAIIGNTCLYGATSGRLFAAGRAGERFAVRNSGADAVVEGCGNNGCEYMTGGMVVILGSVGDNFAAGMTGGSAFVYDPDGVFAKAVNPDSVIWQDLRKDALEAKCRALIEAHYEATGSNFARTLLRDWEIERKHFVQVIPKEMVAQLAAEIKESA